MTEGEREVRLHLSFVRFRVTLASWIAGLVLGMGGLPLLDVPVANAQEDPVAVYATLSDDAKKIVSEANKTLGNDVQAPCNAGRVRVVTDVRAAATRLGESNQLSGNAGFFQIEAENYYNRLCGRRMQR